MPMKAYAAPLEGDLEELKIELTRDCPLSCVHCSCNAVSGSTIRLSLETVLSLISQAADMRVRSIVFSGGEPLVYPWIADAIHACTVHGIDPSLYSTGINHTENGPSQIARLEREGLRRVIFSLYSPQKEVHEQITRKARSFDETLSAIAETNTGRTEVELHVVPFTRNHDHLQGFVDLAQSIGISKIHVLRLVPHGRAIVFKGSGEMLDAKRTAELRKTILKCRELGKVNIRAGSPYNILMLNDGVDCNAARRTLVIDSKGNLYPCDAFKSIMPSDIGLRDTFNNINQHPLRQCWERSLYLKAIRRYLSTPFGQPCSTCDFLDSCKSGCLAQKVLHQEGILGGEITKKPDPLCLREHIGGTHASM